LIKKVVEEDVTRILKPSVLKPSLALRETAVSADAKEKRIDKRAHEQQRVKAPRKARRLNHSFMHL
jgi:hypothetical protein